MKGTLNQNMVPPMVGFEFDNKEIKSKTYMSACATPKFSSELAWRCCEHITVAENTEFDVQKAKETLKTQLAFAGHFDNAFQYGALLKMATVSGNIQSTHSSLYFNHSAGGNVAGCQMEYDYAKKAFASKLGLIFKEDDHTWKVRLHDNGLARLALKWQLHKAVKATIDTSVNLKDVPAGKINGLPFGFTFEVKY
jgi:hypothetical protein